MKISSVFCSSPKLHAAQTVFTAFALFSCLSILNYFSQLLSPSKILAKTCSGSFLSLMSRARFTADILVFHWDGQLLRLLTITRKNPPFQGCLALPGGFVNRGEDAKTAAARELEEETHVRGLDLVFVGTFDKPGRDPRGLVVTNAYLAFAPDMACKADDDAATASFHPVKDLVHQRWSFDHADIVRAALGRAAESAKAGSLASLLPPGTEIPLLSSALQICLEAMEQNKT
eukprot:gnl/TRDRNA2_/TRDRNA2_173417_c0_seq5.p1 gnl/TRDRNA2_/TRDRNA2_173417_c0~~gnl/TRDRNA2_/TRDRNA2_173417_c0_seq5.p1  ORF type:complete len:231 (+),score=33.94 gnl/TRDRNA2_/TRDRNA2_173417_c0_seq5:84-776(+)